MEARTLDLLDWHGNGIVVGRAQELQFPIIVNRSPLSVLHWTFEVEGGGIDFSVMFCDDADERNRMLLRRKHFEVGEEARGSIIVHGLVKQSISCACCCWMLHLCLDGFPEQAAPPALD